MVVILRPKAGTLRIPTPVILEKGLTCLARQTAISCGRASRFWRAPARRLSNVRLGAIFERSERMAASDTTDSVQGGLSDEEKRDNVIRLAFGGDAARLREFCRLVEEVVPPGTTVVLRGSSLTGWRWDHTQPFDGEGPGTSDLDLTLVGDGPLAFFKATGFFVPGVHSRPLSDDDPDIAPNLVPLRQRLMAMVHRPVNIQASREIVIQVRGDLIGQPYLELFRKPDGLSLNGPPAA